MSFYVCGWLINQDSLEPRYTGAWFMPDVNTQHLAETSNVEDLNVLPTKMTSIPTQIQYGCTLWTSDEGFSADATFKEFYVKTQESFYVVSWTSAVDLYDQFYPNAGAFYVQPWTSSTDLYDSFYPNAGAFYVQPWTSSTELYDQFYPNAGVFYIRSFTPVDTWTEFYVPTC